MTTNMEIEKTKVSSIPMLPEDVLYEIFAHLRTGDKKNARLVCRSWFRILSRSYFTRSEGLFFPEFFNFSTIVRAVNEYRRDELNLKLERRRLLKNSKRFWKKCGSRIKSLQFAECSFHQEVMSQIFETCVNLEEFVVDASEVFLLYNGKLAEESFKKSGNNFVRPKLLKLDFGNLPVGISDLKYVASVFPNLKKLAFEVKGNAESHFVAVQKFQEAGQMRNIEELHVNLINLYDFATYLGCENISRAQKLISSNRTMKVTVSYNTQPGLFTEINIHKVSSFDFVTSLSISGWDSRPMDTRLLAGFIRETPMLSRLSFTLFINAVDNFRSIFAALVKSRLARLAIHIILGSRSESSEESFWRSSIEEIDLSLDGLVRNNTVLELDINDHYRVGFSSLFCKYFQGVCDMRMVTEEYETLTTSFLYQKQLRVINLSLEIPESTIISPELVECETVESVEFFEVIIRDCAVELFSLYRFPNLKYLVAHSPMPSLYCWGLGMNPSVAEIRIELSATLQQLASVLTESPIRGVELIIYLDEMETFEFLFQFFRQFRDLHYICLTCHTPVLPDEADLMEEITKHVDEWSSLKVLWIVTDIFIIIYFFNAVTGEYEFFDINDHTYSGSTPFAPSPPIMKTIWKNER